MKTAKKEAEPTIQHQFIKKLKEMVPPTVSLADELADILNVSTDSAYRRLRGETAISLDEAYTICSKYSISIDSVFSAKGDTVTFNYTHLTESSRNFEKYLQGILDTLKKVNSFEKKRIIYAAEGVPLFHSLKDDKHAAFKLFYWQRSVMNVPELQSQKFDTEMISAEIKQLGKKIFQTYVSIPSIEIWTPETVITSLKQVEFYFESGAFKSKEDALDIINEIKKMIEWIQRSAEKETKHENGLTDPGSFSLYNSELVIGTNCIHVNTGDHNFSTISFNTMNSLTTGNQVFCDEVEHWVKNLIKKSELISGTAEKQRYKFFSKVFKSIDASLERVKNA
jgi:hypothetical protein